jgi:DnaK suppressor protein
MSGAEKAHTKAMRDAQTVLSECAPEKRSRTMQLGVVDFSSLAQRGVIWYLIVLLTPRRENAATTTPHAGVNKMAASEQSTNTPVRSPVAGISPYEPKEGEEYMSDAQLEHFREILLAWRKELMEEVDRTVEHMKNEAANFADPSDRATQEEEFSLELRTRDRERKLLKKIAEALTDIDSDEYGFCKSCGAEIGIRRLEARPTATLCIECKTLQEIKEKQMA